MACKECNRFHGFPENYKNWTLCRICKGIGEVIKEKGNREITVRCSHCQGKGVCDKKHK